MSKTQGPLAIVGIGTLFPGQASVAGASAVAGYWRDILAGRDLIKDVPPHYWRTEDYYDPDPRAPDKVYGKRGAFLDKVDFDPLHYGIPPALVPTTDTSQLLALMVAESVLLEAAKGPLGEDLALDHRRTCCVLGVAAGLELLGEMANRLQRPVWQKALADHGIVGDEATRICDSIAALYTDWKESTFPGLLGNVVTGRIANRFDLGGTNCTTDAACASSFSALWAAANELYLGRADLAITGGVDTTNDPFLYMCFSKTPALSMTGDCRPFADDADGTMLGEGVGMVALRRLEDAERDGNRIYAVLRGVGSGSDGRAKSVYAPLAEGQARTLQRAYDAAGYGADTVELVEAHGTGTKPGDLAEFTGLRQVFEAAEGEREGAPRRGYCALGSVKSQIGHTKGAAASAGLIKTALALHEKVLPPTIKVERPSERLNVQQSPFYINTEARPWIRDHREHPRRASISSFGFGGTNFHVTLEEYVGADGDERPTPRLRGFDSELLLLSGESREALVRTLGDLAEELAALPEGKRGDALAHLAVEHAGRFDAAAPARLALVLEGRDDLPAKLRALSQRLAAEEPLRASEGAFFSDAPPAGADELAFVFPGQGSQRVGMGQSLALRFDSCRRVWDRQARRRFAEKVGDGGEGEAEASLALHEVVFPRPVFDDASRKEQEALLRRTEWAQPGLGLSSASMLALLRRAGLEPRFCAGHSFGEVTALHAAGVLDEEALLTVARARGEAMARAAGEASAPGTMCAVVAPKATVLEAIAEVAARGEDLGPLVLANENSPKQCAVSGTVAAIEALETTLAARRVVCKRLPVATAFHSPLVSEASGPFAEALAKVDFAAGREGVTVFANATAAPYPDAGDERRALLASAIARPVRFVEQVEALYAAGARTFVEVGSGRVLSGLLGQILGEDRPPRVVTLDDRQDALGGLWRALGALAVAGHGVDLAAILGEVALPPDPRRAKKPAITLAIDGANYGKPYPSDPSQPTSTSSARPSSRAPAVKEAKPMPERTPPSAEAAAAAPASTPSAAATPTAATPTATLTPIAAPMPAPASVATAVPGAAGGAEWIGAYQQLQAQTAETHAAYQRLMADSHLAYLRAAEASALQLAAVATGQPLAAPTLAAPAPPLPTVPVTPVAAPAAMPTAPMPMAAAPAPMPTAPMPAAPAPMATAPMPAAPAPMPAAPAPTPIPTPAPAVSVEPAPPEVSALDMEALLFEVVAEKTGYPQEVLRKEMALESELGIDSIKRVEILSAIQERVPELPEVDTSEMAALATLGEVLEYMERNAGELLAARTSATATEVSATAPETLPEVDLETLLLGVVADKTGYPREVLHLEMKLESDLGIDSIKRVEILSAVQEEHPELPEVDTTEMAALETLGEVLGYMERLAGGGSEATEPAPVVPTADTTDTPVTVAPAPSLPLGRWVTELVDAPASGFALPGLFGEHCATSRRESASEGERPRRSRGGEEQSELLAAGRNSDAPLAIVDDGQGVAAALVDALASRGVHAERLAILEPDNAAGYRGAIVCAGLTDYSDVTTLREANRRCFSAARALAPRLGGPEGGLFVCVGDAGGDLGLEGRGGARAYAAAAPGLIKSCALEWPQATLKAIDLERGDRAPRTLAAAIVDELFTGGPELEVALDAEGRRRTPRTRAEAALATTELPLAEAGAVVIVSGGGRGVTGPALAELIRARGPRLVLLGRTPLDASLEDDETRGASDEAALKRLLVSRASAAGGTVDAAAVGRQAAAILAQRAIRATISELEALGAAAVRYEPVDVQSREDVAATVAAVRRDWGPITGVVHGAGVLADKRLTDKTDAHFARVFDTKVLGLEALLAATKDDPLELLVVFSSVAARGGNLGQSDYAMANAVLEAVAAAEAQRRGYSCCVRALAWGPWDGGMVTPGLRSHFLRAGVPLIGLDAGAAMLADELRSGYRGPVLATLGGLPLPHSGSYSGAELVGPRQETRLDVWVGGESHPYLDGHRIDDVPVVPVVLVLEWLVRAARLCRPELPVVRCEDLEVLRGVRLERFRDGAAPLTICCRQLENGAKALLAAELRDEVGELRYRATLQLDAARAEEDTAAALDLGELSAEPWPWRGDEVYREQLFHREGFQVIRSLEGVSESGGAAVLGGTRDMGWPEGAWQTDPAALDGGLQLAILWGEKMLGKPSLPTRVGAYHRYADGLVSGPIHCALRGKVVGGSRTVSDITFATAEGDVVAELRGVELHTLPARP